MSALFKLHHKRQDSLENCLHDAMAAGRVLDVYQPSAPQQPSESEPEYVERVRRESQEHQFVGVQHQGQIHYVAFGVPGPIVTPYGTFAMVPAQVVGGRWGVHSVLLYPSLKTLKTMTEEIFVRIDSGCFSGMVLGDNTCDCKEQLELGKHTCVERGAGIVVEIPGHDGRGWGDYKMANQRLMADLGYDTVMAARAFYGGDECVDQRTYVECALILRALGFGEQQRFALGTNNPLKTKALMSLGFQLADSTPVVGKNLSEAVKRNLRAKGSFWRHTIGVL